MPAIEVILNAHGGSFVEDKTEQFVVEEFEKHGITINLRLAKNGAGIEELADAAVDSEAEVIVGGGGDGTISLIASKVYKKNKTLGVLPIGTLNHFSKDLGIPHDLAQAIRIIAENHVRQIDLGEVNGRTFINNSSIGLYPRIVKQREYQQRLGRGKWSAAFTAALRMLRRSPFFRIKLVIDKREFNRTTPFLFVGNNEYEMEIYNIGKRARLDSGKLSVYFLHRSGRTGVFLLLLRTVFGRLREARDFEEVCTEGVLIDTRRKSLLVAFDGEVALLETPLNYRILPGALKVVVPA